jgi:hypothetical protein
MEERENGTKKRSTMMRRVKIQRRWKGKKLDEMNDNYSTAADVTNRRKGRKGREGMRPTRDTEN